MNSKLYILIKPKPPFNFDLSCILTRRLRDKEIICSAYKDRIFYYSVYVENLIIPVKVVFQGDIWDPELHVYSLLPRAEKYYDTITNVVNWIFDVNLNLNEFYNYLSSDFVLKSVFQDLLGLRPLSTPSLFEAIVRAIIEQQLPYFISRRIEDKLIKTLGPYIDVSGYRFYAFPTPEILANTSKDILRNCSLSWRKIEYIQNFSKMVLSKEIDLEKAHRLSSKDFMENFVRIKGIGPWTLRYVLVWALRRYDYTPVEDLFLRKVISHYYFKGKQISKDDVSALCKSWGKWCGLVSYYLIIHYLLNYSNKHLGRIR